MFDDMREVYSRDLISFPLVITGHEVKKGINIGGFDVALDVQRVVEKKYSDFLWL